MDITLKTKKIIEKLFPPDDVDLVADILARECGGNIPQCGECTPEEMERIRFSVLKESNGCIDTLSRCIGLAGLDWRDLLVNAGFADDVHAHEAWAEELLADS
jgi:hypothetical protein